MRRPILPHFPAVGSAECIANLKNRGLAMHALSASTSFHGQRQRRMHSQSQKPGFGYACSVRFYLISRPETAPNGIANLKNRGLAMHALSASTSFHGQRQRRTHSQSQELMFGYASHKRMLPAPARSRAGASARTVLMFLHYCQNTDNREKGSNPLLLFLENRRKR